MIEFIQISLDGLMTGLVYAALALALGVIFQGTGMLNLAQGEMAVLAAYISYTALLLGLPLWLAIPIAIVVSAMVGAAIYFFVVRWVDRRNQTALTTLGVTLMLGINAVISMIWGTDPHRFPPLFGTWVFSFGGVRLTSQQVAAVVLVGGAMAAMALLLTRTNFGLRLRAVAQNGPSAALLGLSGGLWLATGWAVASGVGTIAGVVAAPTMGLSPIMMTVPLLMALAATNLGGITSRVGVVLGGLIIGVLAALGGRYVPGLGGDLNVLLAFGVVIVVVMVKPAGLLGRESTVRA